MLTLFSAPFVYPPTDKLKPTPCIAENVNVGVTPPKIVWLETLSETKTIFPALSIYPSKSTIDIADI